jgi:murein L,D-transpeptidase YcbB/YkuD
MLRFFRATSVLLLLWSPLTGFCETATGSADNVGTAVPSGRPVAHEATLARSLYAHGDLLWSANRRLTPQALKLIDIIRTGESLGLQPEDYGTTQMSVSEQPLMSGSATDAQWRDFDYVLSVAAVRFLTHLHYGRIDPSAAGFELPARPADLDVPAAVSGLAKASDVGAAVAAVEPRFYHYTLLKGALAHYRALAAQPELTRLPAPGRKAPHPGDPYAGVPPLRKLLLAVGDLLPGERPAGADAAEPRLDPYLVIALKRFQQRHGLQQDGALGALTFAALTTPMTQRVRQIELTLERWRWLPALDTPPIIVNIPQFQLFAFRTTADRVADIEQMPVIVGKSYPRTQTPVFVGALKYVIFRPFWDIPHQITVHEMLPQWRAHPDYLTRNHFEIVRGEEVVADQALTPAALADLASGKLRLRQRPGDDNALGPIKFVFPNAHDVYLHGTPVHQLFAQSRRAFSHGCIRVADPVALAAYVLRNTPGDWNAQKITAAMQASQSLRVNLSQPIKVMILYGTVLATEAGPVYFFDDLYGNDRRLARLLWPITRT